MNIVFLCSTDMGHFSGTGVQLGTVHNILVYAFNPKTLGSLQNTHWYALFPTGWFETVKHL